MKSNDRSLRLLALLLIGLAAGSEIVLAAEMTALLEILGAMAFFMAFIIGARMVITDLAAALRDYVCQGFVCRLSAPVMLIHVAPRVLVLGTSILVGGRFLFELHAGKLW